MVNGYGNSALGANRLGLVQDVDIDVRFTILSVLDYAVTLPCVILSRFVKVSLITDKQSVRFKISKFQRYIQIQIHIQVNHV